MFGAADLKGGATSSLYNVCADPRVNHNPVVIHGVLHDESALLLKNFFELKRAGD
jgi:tRNA(adenine34) deaminase